MTHRPHICALKLKSFHNRRPVAVCYWEQTDNWFLTPSQTLVVISRWSNSWDIPRRISSTSSFWGHFPPCTCSPTKPQHNLLFWSDFITTLILWREKEEGINHALILKDLHHLSTGQQCLLLADLWRWACRQRQVGPCLQWSVQVCARGLLLYPPPCWFCTFAAFAENCKSGLERKTKTTFCIICRRLPPFHHLINALPSNTSVFEIHAQCFYTEKHHYLWRWILYLKFIA